MSTERANAKKSNGWKATWRAVKRQADAMGVEVFEIGLFKPATPGDEKPEPEMLPRTWDKQTLLRSVGWLRYQNSQGRNIYIRPKGEHPLSMVDDLTAEAIHQMKQQGFEPCVVVETSPGNFQAWLNHGKVLPKADSTLAARLLAQRFGGDQGAADWRHFGRLAGFTNRKEKYQQQDGRYPFVRLIEAEMERVFAEAELFGLGVLQHCRGSFRKVHSSLTADPQNQSAKVTLLKEIDDFRGNPKYAADQHRIDLAYAVYALSHGVLEETVKSAIGSRDLTKKGDLGRQWRYVERTLNKADMAKSMRRTPSRTK
ncbi:MAG: RepB family DNA primase [Bryobacterales bacterium]|jgi:hypothetical protein|nr:RepB family DNA primase [Bryobacterales bacterium]